MNRPRTPSKIAFGDFQTPPELAQLVCQRLAKILPSPHTIIEPTCGIGNMLLAAMDVFPAHNTTIGLDINPTYIEQLNTTVANRQDAHKVHLFRQDFFDTPWPTMLETLTEPLLLIGNPPWVTNADLSLLESDNLPNKSNFHGFSGLDALTGKSNFDISEWMLIHLLELLNRRTATLAMLCKTSVARRVLTFAWKEDLQITNASLCLIDAKQYFHASVDACLLICSTSTEQTRPFRAKQCTVYQDLLAAEAHTTFGYQDNQLIADLFYYKRWRHLCGTSSYQWRSGIKHDCAKILELHKEHTENIDDSIVQNLDFHSIEKIESEHCCYKNGLGESITLESTHIYGLLKSSDIANSSTPYPRRFLIVPQKKIGEETSQLQQTAPFTWYYLSRHGNLLDKRKSSIYKKQPRFAIFGIGPYTFAKWKVAISGLYKSLQFAVVGPYQDKPVVLDDTCYFIACSSADEAQLIARMLNSEVAQQFFQAFIFFDNKRPITARLLNQLDLTALAKELHCTAEFSQLSFSSQNTVQPETQLSLFS